MLDCNFFRLRIRNEELGGWRTVILLVNSPPVRALAELVFSLRISDHDVYFSNICALSDAAWDEDPPSTVWR